MPVDYYAPFAINDMGFYATQLVEWNPFGTPSFANNGQPIPYGPGNFSVILLGIPYDHTYYPSVDPEVVGSTHRGSYLELFALWQASLGSQDVLSGINPTTGENIYTNKPVNGMVKVSVFDPMADSYRTVNARMPFPELFTGFSGTSKVNARLDFTGAFLSDSQVSDYTGGYVQPGGGGYIFGDGNVDPGTVDPDPTDPPYIPGDLPPGPDPTLDYFFGTGLYGSGFYGRGQGVPH